MSRTAELKNYLREKSRAGIALAFSGGVDSTFLLAVLKELCDETPFPLQALTMRTVFQRPDELSEARQTASSCGVELAEFSCDPLSLPQLRNNPVDRCYWCKRHIFQVFRDHAAENRLGVLMDGTNGDDLHVYRPGRRALRELGVVSPLAELGFTKAEIRQLAAERGLQCAKKPAMPCLATRFEYGTELTPERLKMASGGEELIRHLLLPETDLRLRVHDRIARIEVSPEALETVLRNREGIAAGLKKLGFEFITLDLEGFRSGCYDKKEETL